jgi:hypothetical protein
MQEYAELDEVDVSDLQLLREAVQARELENFFFKGRRMDQQEVYGIFRHIWPNAEPGTDTFILRSLVLRQVILDKTEFSANFSKGDMVILTDSQAVKYHQDQMDAGRKKMRAHFRFCKTKPSLSGLTDQERAQRDKTIQSWSDRINALDLRKRISWRGKPR